MAPRAARALAPAALPPAHRLDPLPPRRPDWFDALSRYLARTARTPFAYGRMDCALFVAGALAAMTGVDPARPWRGRYQTLRGGLRHLRRAGFAGPDAVASALLPEIPSALAQPGDLALLLTADGPALGIVAGAAVLYRRPEGLGSLPLTHSTRAFRVI